MFAIFGLSGSLMSFCTSIAGVNASFGLSRIGTMGGVIGSFILEAACPSSDRRCRATAATAAARRSRTWAPSEVADIDIGQITVGFTDRMNDRDARAKISKRQDGPRLTKVDVPTAQGLALTAIRSGTGIGVGSQLQRRELRWEEDVVDVLLEVFPDRLLFKCLPEERIKLMTFHRESRPLSPNLAVSVGHLP